MARLQKKMQAAGTTGSAETSGIPRAMVLRFIRDLPGDRLSCPRRDTARSARCAWHQHRDARTTRFHRRIEAVRPHDQSHDDPTRPPHPAPDVRDDREAPPRMGRDAEVKARFLKNSNRNIFTRAGDWPSGIEMLAKLAFQSALFIDQRLVAASSADHLSVREKRSLHANGCSRVTGSPEHTGN